MGNKRKGRYLGLCLFPAWVDTGIVTEMGNAECRIGPLFYPVWGKGWLESEYIEFEMIVRHPCGDLAVDYIPRLDLKFRSPKHMSSIKTNRIDVKVKCID